jgi:hypothetical protein
MDVGVVRVLDQFGHQRVGIPHEVLRPGASPTGGGRLRGSKPHSVVGGTRHLSEGFVERRQFVEDEDEDEDEEISIA